MIRMLHAIGPAGSAFPRGFGRVGDVPRDGAGHIGVSVA